MSWRAVKGGEYQKGSGCQLDRVKKICYNNTGGAHSYKYVYTATGAIHSIESTESGSPIGMQYRTTSYAANTFDTFYFEKNLQGDIIAVYNASGTKVLSYTYDAWGNHTVTWHNSSGTNLYAQYNPFRYRGYYYDTETGLYYLQSRYYNPAWGRFLNVDGLIYSNAGLIGYNMYVYCGNEPVGGYDPTGYEDLCEEDGDDNNVFNDVDSVKGSHGATAGPGTGASASAGTGKSGGGGTNSSGTSTNTSVAEKTEVHHIVERCQVNKSGFSKNQIETESNKISLPYDVHRKLSGFYSSKPQEYGGLRVRDWLAGQSFEYQTQFGRNKITEFGGPAW